MIIGIGIDIIEVDRIRENIEKFGNRFLERVFTQNEMQYCDSKNVQKYQSYAGRFAAKEAVFKAISSQLSNKYAIQWTDIEVLNQESGIPVVYLHGKLEELFGKGFTISVSISHIDKTAVANCICEKF